MQCTLDILWVHIFVTRDGVSIPKSWVLVLLNFKKSVAYLERIYEFLIEIL